MKSNKKKKTIITVVCIMLVLALGVGSIAYFTNPKRRVVNVYHVSDLAMTDFWGDNPTIYGEVHADNVQAVYLSDTQQVTEVYVTQGQNVKPGDKLMAYDTTLSQLSVDRKTLEIKLMQEELNDAKIEYNTLAGSKVYSVTTSKDSTTTSKNNTTTTKNNNTTTTKKNNASATNLSTQTQQDNESTKPLRTAKKSSELTENQTEDTSEIENAETMLHTENAAGSEETALEESTDDSADDPSSDPSEKDENVQVKTYACKSGTGTSDDPYLYVCANGIPFGEDFLEELGFIDPETGLAVSQGPVYVVFGISEGNMLNGKILQAGGMCFSGTGADVSFILFDASGYIGRPFGEPKPEKPPMEPDNDDPSGDDPSGDDPSGDDPSGNNPSGGNTSGNNPSGNNPSGGNTSGGNTSGNNTSGSHSSGNTSGNSSSNKPSYSETQAQKAELQQKIKDLDLDLRMAQVELKQMKQELSDGVVYADMAGTIAEVISADEALNSKEPIIKVAGGGGYYIQGTVSELDLDDVYIGQSVTVNCWESGNVYQGTVKEISDTPTENGYYNGNGNMNVSYYPFTVVVDGDVSFREYEGVEMTLDIPVQVSDAFYLEQPFVLQENGENYVYLAGEDGMLEKRRISVGVMLWGSYVQVLDGLTLEDTVAFPYGKDVVEGATTNPSTLDALYSW